jgi:hypothetical protein
MSKRDARMSLFMGQSSREAQSDNIPGRTSQETGHARSQRSANKPLQGHRWHRNAYIRKLTFSLLLAVAVKATCLSLSLSDKTHPHWGSPGALHTEQSTPRRVSIDTTIAAVNRCLQHGGAAAAGGSLVRRRPPDGCLSMC